MPVAAPGAARDQFQILGLTRVSRHVYLTDLTDPRRYCTYLFPGSSVVEWTVVTVRSVVRIHPWEPFSSASRATGAARRALTRLRTAGTPAAPKIERAYHATKLAFAGSWLAYRNL